MPGPSDNNQAELQHAPVCQSHKDCQLHWYAVRVTYSRELSLKDYLDKENIENFIPMRYEYVIRNERRVRKLVPAIHNLVFLRSTRSRIDEIKNNPVLNIPVRYIMNRETHQPVIIPDAQMRSFILVAGTYDEAVIYVEPEEAVGEFVRLRHDRRVVVNIEGVMAVATTFIHSSLIEPIGVI